MNDPKFCQEEEVASGEVDPTIDATPPPAAAPMPSPPIDRAAGAGRDPVRETAGWDGTGADETPPHPERIGRYAIRRVLGRGAFGVVYLARDEDLDRDVALKVPRAHLVDSAEKQRAFLKEARALAALDHPGIVAVFDFGLAEDDRCYVVSKYVEGRTLSALASEGPLPHRRAAALVADVAEALQHAHLSGLVHRDVKPTNVLVDDEGRATVVDFGLAVHESEQRARRDEISGTPAYMAPEQVRGEVHHVDGRADVWALGVVLYELLTGRPPFRGSTRRELFDEILTREPKPLRMVDETIPAELDRITLECLRKPVSERCATAADLARALRAWLDGPTDPGSAAGWRSPTGIATVVLATLFLVAVGWFVRDRIAAVNAGNGSGAEAAILDGNLELVVHRSTPDAAGADANALTFGLADEEHLPLRHGDAVRLEATLSEPAFAYVVWIESDGHVIPLHPWEPGSWERPAGDESPLRTLAIPAEDAWAMSGTRGTELLLLLARPEPLPVEVDLRRLLADLAEELADRDRLTKSGVPVAWIEHGGLPRRDRGPRVEQRQPVDDPLAEVRTLLRERLGEHFPLIRAVAVENRGR